jgi:hypothetical protein
MGGDEKLTKEATEAGWDSEVSHQRVEHGWEGKRCDRRRLAGMEKRHVAGGGEEIRDVRRRWF